MNSNVDTSFVGDGRMMFYNCSFLISLNLRGIDTGNFYDIRSMFRSCSSLTLLVLRDFNTKNVQYTTSMFRNCEKMIKIYVTSQKWNMEKVLNSNDMFTDCGVSEVTYEE